MNTPSTVHHSVHLLVGSQHYYSHELLEQLNRQVNELLSELR